jgi:hypothetical protein
MNNSHRVPILRIGDTALYGRILDNTGKIGRYEVNGVLYHRFAEAEAAFKRATAFAHNTNYKPKTP